MCGKCDELSREVERLQRLDLPRPELVFPQEFGHPQVPPLEEPVYRWSDRQIEEFDRQAVAYETLIHEKDPLLQVRNAWATFLQAYGATPETVMGGDQPWFKSFLSAVGDQGYYPLTLPEQVAAQPVRDLRGTSVNISRKWTLREIVDTAKAQIIEKSIWDAPSGARKFLHSYERIPGVDYDHEFEMQAANLLAAEIEIGRLRRNAKDGKLIPIEGHPECPGWDGRALFCPCGKTRPRFNSSECHWRNPLVRVDFLQ